MSMLMVMSMFMSMSVFGVDDDTGAAVVGYTDGNVDSDA